MNPTTLFIIVIAAFLVYRVVWRAIKLTTRQRVNVGAMLTRIAFLVALSALVLSAALHQQLALVGAVTGLLAGGAVAWYGLRLTRFERQADGLYYTPNKYVGLTLFIIFLARLVYKMVTLIPLFEQLASHPTSNGSADPLASYTSDPLTTAVYFLLVGYYIVYYIALMLRRRRAVGDPTTPVTSSIGGGALDS